MLAWVLNTPLLFEDSLNVLILYIIRFLKSVISLEYFTSFNSSNIILNIELLNQYYSFTRTKTLVNNLLMSKF